MIQQIYRQLAAQFKLPMENANRAGSSIMADETREASGAQIVWTFDKHVVIQCHPQFVTLFEALIETDKALSIAEIVEALDITVREQGNFYSISKDDFIAHDSDYTVRELTESDCEAFDAYHAQCSEQDREYGQVGLSDETIVGALDGGRIIAAASTFKGKIAEEVEAV